MWIEWPDLLLPRDRQQAIRHIRTLHGHARAGRPVEVACSGGVGRTGTVIACLAVLAGLPPADAVDWARTHYHRSAVHVGTRIETRSERLAATRAHRRRSRLSWTTVATRFPSRSKNRPVDSASASWYTGLVSS